MKVLVLSIDPYQRHRMHDPSIPSYFVSLDGSCSGIIDLTVFLVQARFQGWRTVRTYQQSHWRVLTVSTSLENDGVGVVVRSENSKYKKGDHVNGMFRE